METRCNLGGEAEIGGGELCETSLPVRATSCVGSLLPCWTRSYFRFRWGGVVFAIGLPLPVTSKPRHQLLMLSVQVKRN